MTVEEGIVASPALGHAREYRVCLRFHHPKRYPPETEITFEQARRPNLLRCAFCACSCTLYKPRSVPGASTMHVPPQPHAHWLHCTTHHP